MKITDAKVIVCCPGRNFVTLKIITDQGIYGLGDATLNGMEKSVVAYLENYCIPSLNWAEIPEILKIYGTISTGGFTGDAVLYQ